MKLEIRWRSAEPSESVAQIIHRKAAFALGRLARRAGPVDVVVRLEDHNGPKGGVDKEVAVRIAGAFGVRIAKARAADFAVAASEALETAARHLERVLDRPVRARPRPFPV